MAEFDVKGAILNWLLLFALIAFVYWIWRTFSRLAEKFHKQKWMYGLLGIFTFFFGANVIAVILEIFIADYILSGILRLPIGLLSCWGLYKYLQKSWTKAID